MKKCVEDDRSNLEARINRSKLYHQRHRAFLEALHKWIMFLIIVSGSAAVSDVFGDLRAFGLVAAVLAAIDLIYSPGLKARDHGVLFRRFSEAGAALNEIPAE